MVGNYSAQFEPLRNRTKDFALRIIRLFRALPHTEEARIIGKQFLRSGTSIGANYPAACRARSRADFIAKLEMVLEEADETAYWLELLVEGKIIERAKLAPLLPETNELVSIFAASIAPPSTTRRSRTSPHGILNFEL